MKHIQNKLTRALSTKDWRLVEEAWWMAGESEVGIKDFSKRDKPEPIPHNID